MGDEVSPHSDLPEWWSLPSWFLDALTAPHRWLAALLEVVDAR